MKSLGEFLSFSKVLSFNRPYLYEVKLMNDRDGIASLLCHQAAIPGWSLATQNVKIYGLSVEVPFELKYDQINLSFYVDSKLNILNFFEQEKNNIIDNVDFSPNWYDNFANKEMAIEIIDTSNSIPVGYFVLTNAYLKSVSSIALDWAAQNQIQSVTVTYTFESMRAELDAATNSNLYPDPAELMNSYSGLGNNVPLPINFDTIQRLAPSLATSFNQAKSEVKKTVSAAFPVNLSNFF